MLSMLLATALCTVADAPRAQTAPVKAANANRAYNPAPNYSYYEPMNYYSHSYSPPQGGFGCGCGNPFYCPTDDVFLDLPCLPCAPCPVTAVRPVGTPRIYVHTPPPPVRYCPKCVPSCP